ncbi:MAG: tyrosine-type recombinase/integrase, partial [Ruminococcus sp.]
NGKEITPNYLTKKFHTLIEKQNDFPQIRFHDLRHSVASNLLNDGFTTVQVAEWLGHSSSTTTLKFYAHIDKTSKLAIAKKPASGLISTLFLQHLKPL